jgi:hypothetical protein
MLYLYATKPQINKPMIISVKEMSEEEFHQIGIDEWPIWEKEVSVFDWSYQEKEQFYLLEGEVDIITPAGKFHVKPGDFVECPKGLDCHWEIRKYVKKHYHFVSE